MNETEAKQVDTAKLINALNFVNIGQHSDSTEKFEHPDGFYYQVSRITWRDGSQVYDLMTWTPEQRLRDFDLRFTQDGFVTTGQSSWYRLHSLDGQRERKVKAIQALS